MRSITKMFAMSACMLMVGAPLAIADEVSDELAEMRTLVEQLKGQVDAQSEQIDHQGEVIQEARLDRTREDDSRLGSSGIVSFLQRLEIEGLVAASYFWNYNNPDIDYGENHAPNPFVNQGYSGNVYPFHGSHNSFQVDQIWFGIEHPIDEENRAGFRFDILWGTTARNLGNSSRGDFFDEGRFDTCDFDDLTSCMYVNQAYIQYLIPLTSNGIRMKAGKFSTLVGAEVWQQNGNFNITRGNVFNIMQPIDHVGVLFDTQWGESGFTTAVGIANSSTNGAGSDPDYHKGKAVIGQLGWSGETLGAAVTALWGQDTWSGSSDKYESTGLIDLVLTWDPTERISTWLNFDYGWFKPGGDGLIPHAYGVAVAGRYAVTERFGISTRYEWVGDRNGYAGWTSLAEDLPKDNDIHSITGTLDYALTNNLMVRGEVRWDTVSKDQSTDKEFWDRPRGNLVSDQVTTGVELVYEF